MDGYRDGGTSRSLDGYRDGGTSRSLDGYRDGGTSRYWMATEMMELVEHWMATKKVGLAEHWMVREDPEDLEKEIEEFSDIQKRILKVKRSQKVKMQPSLLTVIVNSYLMFCFTRYLNGHVAGINNIIGMSLVWIIPVYIYMHVTLSYYS